MSQPVYLLCGIPTAGKTWITNQLGQSFSVVQNDDYIGNPEAQWKAIMLASKGKKPVLVDSPFGESKMRERLEGAGLKVHPYFVLVDPETAKDRYEERGKGPMPKSMSVRAMSIKNRAKEWDAPMGDSAHILSLLKAI